MKKAHVLRCARPTRCNVLLRTSSLVDLRAPRIWTFLISLDEHYGLRKEPRTTKSLFSDLLKLVVDSKYVSVFPKESTERGQVVFDSRHSQRLPESCLITRHDRQARIDFERFDRFEST
jgi:hypothetical protein